MGKNHLDTAVSYNNIGKVYYNLRDFPKALKYFQRTLPIMGAGLEGNHPYTAAVYNSIGTVYEALGDIPKAITYYRQAQGIYAVLPGEEFASKTEEIRKQIETLEHK